jgi:hypothetical protein
VVVSCKHGNETSGSVNGGDFIDQLNDYWLFKDSALWSSLVLRVRLNIKLISSPDYFI